MLASFLYDRLKTFTAAFARNFGMEETRDE